MTKKQMLVWKRESIDQALLELEAELLAQYSQWVTVQGAHNEN